MADISLANTSYINATFAITVMVHGGNDALRVVLKGEAGTWKQMIVWDSMSMT